MYYDVPEGLGLRKIAAGWFDNLNSAESLMNVHDSMDPQALDILGMYNRARMPHDNFKYKPALEDPRKLLAQRYGRHMLSKRYQQDQRYISNPKGVNRATSPQSAARQPAGNRHVFTPEQRRSLISGLAAGGGLGQAIPHSGIQQMFNRSRGGGVKNAPVIPQRPNIPAPADDPAPTNQRPAGYGTTPKPAPSTWTQKIKNYRNGLAGPANATIEFRRHMYQQGQRLLNSPFTQRVIDRMRSGSK